MTPNPTSSGLGLALLTLSSAIMIFLAKRIKPIRLLASTLKLSSSSQMETSNNAMSQYWLKRDHENNFLEEVLGDKALSWVREQNAKCMVAVGNPESSPLYNRILGILDSKDKIPYITKIGNNYYNFWQDAQNKKGILRRTTLESFKTVSPEWVTVLDVDALAAAEGENWVYKGYSLLTEDDSTIEPSLILLSLSRAGADATVVREFNLSTGSFVPNGFYVPESKSRVSWKSRDVLFIGTDLKDGNSLTDSGYPRTVREWKRGTKLEDSTLLFAGQKTDVAVSANLAKHRGFKIEVFSRSVTFYTSEYSVALVSGPKSGVGFSSSVVRTTLNIPDFVKLGFFADQLLLTLRKSWNVGGREYPAGSLLATSLTDFLAKQGTIDSVSFCVIFEPTDTASLVSYTRTKTLLILTVLESVKTRLVFWKYNDLSNRWLYSGAESKGYVRGAFLDAVDDDESDDYWLTTNSFLQPSTLSIADGAKDGVGSVQVAEKLKQLPAQFDSSGLEESQGFAVSRDGTRVPYFIVAKKNLKLDGSHPTLLYGYGGFEISMTPSYAAIVGTGWLERGGIYVCANIRGGGEFGPKWHQAALKENRCLAYDDFIAVAEDLITRGITSSPRLGIRGGSNGGLLMGNMITRRPDLFGAVCCAVPLLDMHRYHTLLAGASWMAEYGDPSTSDWSFLQQYSAYHNISPSNACTYPPLLMTTSTRDDRVHPYHARAFSKRLMDTKKESSINTVVSPVPTDILDASADTNGVYYYENIEGGHGGAADNKQQAFMNVLYLDFLWKTIGRK